MDKAKHQMSAKAAKAMSKEIDKKGSADLVFAKPNTAPTERKPLETKEMVFAREKKMLVSKSTSAGEKLKTHGKKHSKRTTPNPELPGESAPAHVHTEGARWIKT